MASTKLEALSLENAAENVALSQSVGWPDDSADWRVIYASALVLGAREAGTLIAQGALGRYEHHAGTIAKMVVAPHAQRRGLGSRILDELIEHAERGGITALGLVATPFGQALYATRGFEVTGEVAVFLGQPALDRPPSGVTELTDIESAIAFEGRLISCSRANMLRARFRDANARVVCVHASGALAGFALATPKATHTAVGPIIAESEDTARELARAAIQAISGPIRIDVPAQLTTFRAWLRGLGVPEVGLRAEMTRGAALPWQVPARFALVTQAWG